jgi:hypothetical protein
MVGAISRRVMAGGRYKYVYRMEQVAGTMVWGLLWVDELHYSTMAIMISSVLDGPMLFLL